MTENERSKDIRHAIRRVALVSSGPPLSLKVLYCLHALGIETDVIDIGETSVARFSRYRRRYACLSTTAADPSDVVESLHSHIQTHAIDAVIGGDIDATGLINSAKDRLKPALCFPSADIDTLELLDDKWRFQQFLVEHRLPVPQSALLQEGDDLDAKIAALTFPVIAKPLHGESGHGIVSLQGVAQLREHLSSGSRYAKPPLLLQEYAPGS